MADSPYDNDDQRRDELLRRVLKSPPMTREQLKAELQVAREAKRAAKRAAALATAPRKSKESPKHGGDAHR